LDSREEGARVARSEMIKGTKLVSTCLEGVCLW
jgi:hypothetical protein